ncbi:MAG: glycerate kinase [Actinobacteria bacterium RBG_16_64_13]|nr:MAG: glycerate kinase [Actinobacteria bacterium RBG_16_64_13]
MKKIVVAPDSFKVTMTSSEVCDLMAEGIRRVFPDATVTKLPTADGGEGTVDAVVGALGGSRRTIAAKDPFFHDIRASYGVVHNGRTAIVEMAAASGLGLVGDRGNPWLTTTYGTGQLLAHALEAGCEELVVGIGGSATNDGGVGMAAALGFRFLDRDGNDIVPTGGGLADLAKIDPSGRHRLLGQRPITAACDVDNPLCGPRGASRIFGPQKGADPEMADRLDRNLQHLAEVVSRDLAVDILDLPGGGAAGGLGAGMVVFTGASLVSGIDLVLDLIGFDGVLEGADLVITGEGRLDAQSLGGKVPIGVARRAAKAGVPVVAIVGEIAGDLSRVYETGIRAVFPTNRDGRPFSEARKTAREDLVTAVISAMRGLETLGEQR